MNIRVSTAQLWIGWALSIVPSLFLLLDGVMKLFKPGFVVEATVTLGYTEDVILPLGVVLLGCTILYLIPRTSLVGAILLTGYLGGAVASHLRHGDSWFTIFFPVIFGVLLWVGLVLRDERLRSVVLGCCHENHSD